MISVIGKHIIIIAFLVSIIIISFLIVLLRSIEDPSTEIQQRSNIYQNAELRVEIIPSISNTFGYDIWLNGKILIHQTHPPALSGREGFKTEEDAKRIAEFVVERIRRNMFPPTVTVEELDSLEVHLPLKGATFKMTLKSVVFTLTVLCLSHDIVDGQAAWTRKADFGGNSGSGIGFSIGNKGYIAVSHQKDFWEYDPSSNIWTQKADFGGTARYGAVGFSIGDKGYIGTGNDGADRKDFWEYDPSLNTWTQKADFGGIARHGAVGFSIGDKGYIGTGNDGSYCEDFWEYDPINNNWSKKHSFGGSIKTRAVGFSIGNKGYIGTGFGDSGDQKDFWEYDPSSNTWTRKADFGGTARDAAVGFSIGDKGYIGTGIYSTDFHNVGQQNVYEKDFWEYDPINNNWSQNHPFGGSPRTGAVGFSIGDKGYIGMGFGSGVEQKDFWEYVQSKLPVPEQVELLYPLDSADVEVDAQETKVLFNWNETHPVVINYALDISSDSNFSPIIFSDTSVLGTYHVSETLENNQKYWWRVKARNFVGWGPYSESRSFNTLFGNYPGIDIMVVYTPAEEVSADFWGGIDLVIAQAMMTAQEVIYGSGVNTSIRLVHSGLISYTESGDGLLDIDRLTNTNDGYMDEVHQWRYSYAADLVVLLCNTGGMGWLLTDVNGRPDLGFSTSDVNGAYLDYSFIHELGHNMGMEHSRNQKIRPAPARGGLFEFSTGWRWIDKDGVKYASVMTYPEDALWVPVFSNPSILWGEGTPAGSYDPNDPYAPADNARTLREIKDVIAGYSSRLAPTFVERDPTQTPVEFSLGQNFPNPFNASTTISFSLPSKSFASLKVFDVIGREVATIVSEELPAGNYSRQWNAVNMTSGIYFYRLQAGSFTETKKLILLR